MKMGQSDLKPVSVKPEKNKGNWQKSPSSASNSYKSSLLQLAHKKSHIIPFPSLQAGYSTIEAANKNAV